MAIRDAVAAVFVCEDRIFLVKRQPYLKAFPGYHAFPGGKVDRDERDTPIDIPLFKDFEPRLMHALIREMDEELGIDLQQSARSGLIKDFSLFTEVTTPDFHHHRFRTRFYKIGLNSMPDFTVDEAEVEKHCWETGHELMDRYHKGELLVAPPLRRMIEVLRDNPASSEAPDAEFRYDPKTEVPCMEAIGGVYQLLVQSKTIPPAAHTNAFVIGDYLVDPSPKSKKEMGKLLTTLKRFDLKGIFLTHHHGDHHQHAPDLARTLDLPILISDDSHQRLTAKKRQYFKDIQIKIIKDGDHITTWKDETVRVYAVPGHDEGQMALAPDSMAWFIVGDLIQGIGTVVISEPEGNMKKYFETLQRVIDLDPKIIFPSHGMGMGTTFRLQETLKHRVQREDQVLELHQQGKNKLQMLAAIYKGLNPILMPLAMKNIESHMAKLKEESRI